jgi:hypothetical protein
MTVGSGDWLGTRGLTLRHEAFEAPASVRSTSKPSLLKNRLHLTDSITGRPLFRYSCGNRALRSSRTNRRAVLGSLSGFGQPISEAKNSDATSVRISVFLGFMSERAKPNAEPNNTSDHGSSREHEDHQQLSVCVSKKQRRFHILPNVTDEPRCWLARAVRKHRS